MISLKAVIPPLPPSIRPDIIPLFWFAAVLG